MGCNTHELSVVLTDDAHIQELNSTYRGKDHPTNVLSFPMQEGEYGDITPGLLGDIVISCETAQAEAAEAGISLSERMSQLLIHGVLHLLGFDHEADDKSALEMEQKSRELLSILEPDKKLDIF